MKSMIEYRGALTGKKYFLKELYKANYKLIYKSKVSLLIENVKERNYVIINRKRSLFK